MTVDSIVRANLDRKARGWASLADELRAMLDRMRAERDRLLGPERGE